MSFDKEEITSKIQWSFTNILALLVVIISSTYFFWISFVLTKNEVKDNGSLNQITIVMVTLITLVLNYYFGSSNSSARQQQQITEMQKTATTVAITASNLAASNLAGNTSTPESVEIKVDKAVKIAELKAALEKLEPNSEDAKRIVAELEELEKLT